MRARQPLLLLHPLFLISLGLLLLNDFCLKYEFHNVLTGKLSDVAGLFAFTIFLLVLFPRHKKIVLLFDALFFLWWKSPFSDPVILFLNTDWQLPVHRVIDYSDYWALPVVPLALYLKPVAYPPALIRTVAIWLIGIVSFCSFTATSMIRKLADTNRVEVDKYIHTNKSEKEIVTSLERAGLKPQKIPAIYEREWRRRFYVRATDKFGDTVLTPLDDLYRELYRKIDYGTAYNIPVMYVRNDTIFNLQFIISESYGRRGINLHSFEYRRPAIDTGSQAYNGLQYESYRISKRIGKPLKKKIRQIIRNKN